MARAKANSNAAQADLKNDDQDYTDSEEGMTAFMNIPFVEDVEAPEAVPPGLYSLRMINGELKVYNGKPVIKCRYKIVDQPGSKKLTYMLWLPYADPKKSEEEQAEEIQSASLRYKYFCEAHSLSYPLQPTDIEFEDLYELEPEAELGTKDDPTYGVQNTIIKWVNPA